ncbi:prolipoprotein diacylglyceryl transferase [Mycolicibacterium sp. XJ1819]
MTTSVLAYIPSPSQGVWYVGGFPIRAYALFIIVGIVAALVVGDRRWEARGGERGVIYDIALWAVPFGLIGGRVYHVITDWPKYFGDGGAGFIGAVRVWDGGLGIWGAVALGGVGAWIGCRRAGIPLPAFGDAIAPGIVLAQAIGRLGNYFNQELYGRPTTMPWGLEIYERTNASGVVSPDLANGVSTGQLHSVVHPTFLYELLWNLLVFAVLIWADRRFKLGHGRLFALYVAGYCLGRFWIELMRDDQATLIADIRVNSFTSTFVFIGAVVYLMVAPKGREDPASLKGKQVAEAEPQERASVEDLVKDLSAAGSLGGVVAAAKVAADSDETAESEAASEAEALSVDVTEAPAEDADAEDAEEGEAEALGADVAGVPADSVAEAEEFAAEGDEEPESDVPEAAAEAEALAEDVTEAPAEEIAEAEEFAAAGEEAEAEEAVEAEAESEAEPAGGVGAVEGEEAVEAQEGAAEAHEAVVDGAVEAEETAAEVAAEQADDEDAGADESEPSDVEAGPVGGVGAVEGEEAVEAQEGAAEAHEAAVEGAAEAEETAAEQPDDADDVADEGEEADAEPSDDEQADDEIAVTNEAEESGDDAEPVGGVGAVEGEEAVEAQEGAAEAHEAAVEGVADAAEVKDAAEAESAEPESGGRVRGWLRRRRKG